MFYRNIRSTTPHTRIHIQQTYFRLTKTGIHIKNHSLSHNLNFWEGNVLTDKTAGWLSEFKLFGNLSMLPGLLVLYILLSITPKAKADNCNVYYVDLTASSEESWQTPGQITPEGSCCGNSGNCFQFVIDLHPDASSLQIEFMSGPMSNNFRYQVNCGEAITATPLMHFCFDEPGPHTITFCRPGTPPPYGITFRTAEMGFPVSLEPFEPVCEDTPLFLLEGGWPEGGSYYLNNTEVFFFNPTSMEAGDYEIVYEYIDPASGCSGSASQTITVNEVPVIDFDDLSFCEDEGIINLITHGGADPPGGYYTGNHITNNIFDVPAAGPGDHEVTYHYTSDEGCSNTATAIITVNELPYAYAGEDQTIFSGSSTTLTGNDGDFYDGYAYSWTPAHMTANPNQQTTETNPIDNSTQFTLTVTDTETGCSARDRVIINVIGNDLHITDIESSPEALCVGESAQLWVLPGGGLNGNYTYLWTANPPDPSLAGQNTIRDPEVSPAVTTTYTITVGDADAPGADPATGQIVVEVHPLPTVSLSNIAPVCANTPGFSILGIESPLGGIFSFTDIHGIPMNRPGLDPGNFLPYEIGEGDFIVLYEYTDPATGCSNSATTPLEIYPYVEAQFYTYVPNLCETDVINISNHSIGADSYWWVFGDGNADDRDDDKFTYIFDTQGETSAQEYTITLTATDEITGCEHTRERTVRVSPAVIADFEVSETDGCSSLEVDFTNQSVGPIQLFFWNFGDGIYSTETHPSHTFVNNTNDTIVYEVTLTVLATNFFCMETHTMEITVYPYIEPGFTISPIAGCHPFEAEFISTAIGPVDYHWDFGNGETSTEAAPPIQTYTNTTAEIIEHTIIQTVSYSFDGEVKCSKQVSQTLQVFPEVTAGFEVSDTIGCAPFTVDFTNASSVGTTHFNWDFDDEGSSSQENPTHTFENDTDETVVYTVWLRVRSDEFCRDSISQDIYVHPRIKAGFDFDPAEACNPYELQINNTSEGIISGYAWDFGDGNTSDESGPVVSHVFEHDEDTPQTYTILLEIENEQGCTDTLSRKITIYPKITASYTPSAFEGCSPLTVNFENHSIGVNEYQWDFGDGGTSPLAGPTHTFVNTSYEGIAEFDVHLHTRSQWGCTADTIQRITVFPAIKADFTIAETAGCSPFIVTLENNSLGTPDMVLSWNFGDGTEYESTDDLIFHTFENTTNEILTFDITLTATNEFGCDSILTRTITVYPEVDILFSHEEAGCHPFEVSFINETENANFFNWTFGDGLESDAHSPVHIYHNFSHTQVAEYDIELFALSENGCFASATSQVEVFPKPAAQFQVENSPDCSPHEIIISNTTIGASTFEWSFGDGSDTSSEDGPTITHTYNHEPGTGPGYFDITLYVENGFGCSDTLVQQVVIYPNVVADFSADVIEGCHPLTVEFLNESEGATASRAYFWEYGNGLSSENLQELHTHTFTNYSHTRDTVYTVRLWAYNENGCFDETTLDIRVNPKPRAFFSVPNTPACGPHDAIIHNFSMGADIYEWDMGDGNIFDYATDHFTHEYTQPAGDGPGVFTITLDVENQHGCVDTYNRNIIIYPEINVDFTTDFQGCHEHLAVFENTTEGGDIFHWDFGNGNFSEANNPAETFLNYSHTQSESYTVTLSSESHYGCRSSASHEITVWPIPKAEFQLSELSGCSPFTPSLENTSVGATEYLWDMGDGNEATTNGSFQHTWHNLTEAPVNYVLSLQVINEFGCPSQVSQSILVYPEVSAGFTSEGDVWEGCSPLDIRFLNDSELADTYRWDFGDGTASSSANPIHQFVNNQTTEQSFTVEQIVTSIYGCTDLVSHEVTVFPSPIARFTALPLTQPYPNATITLNNLTNEGYWDFHWEFGDENNLTTQSPAPFTHTYIWDANDMSTKTYVVALHVSNEHCDDLYTQEVTITSPVPEADVSSVTTSGCEPYTVQFRNHSRYAHSYRWEFGDGSISVHPEPTHTFVDYGLYEVMLIAIGDGGRDTTYHYVEVHQNPTAKFELVSSLVNIPEEPLLVINQSELGDFYHWEFGDGNTSNDFEPVYYYTETGIYSITLTVTRDTDPPCSDQITLENVLRVDETCKIIFPNAFIPDKSGPSGGHVDPGNPSTSIFHPVYEGVEKYVLEIYNRWGELIYRSEDPDIGWDGYVNRQLSKMDVYVWKVTGRCTNGRSIIMAGDVTLYR